MLQKTLLLSHSDKVFLDLLYLESKICLPGSSLGNHNMNYYDAIISADDKMKRHVMYIPSKVYIFNHLNYEIDAIKYGIKSVEAKHDRDCAVFIAYPNKDVTGSLLLKCHKISTHQMISELSLKGLNCDNLSKRNVFAMSKNAESVTLSDCTFPEHVAAHLQQELSECTGLKSLCFTDTNIVDTTFLHKLQRMTALTALVLVNTNLCPVEGKFVCEQLKILSNLSKLWISIPGLGVHGQHISEALQVWGPESCLKELLLRNCDIPVNVCSSLLSSLPKALEYLHLSGNILTECLQHIPNLESLRFLYMSRTSLTKEDLHHFNKLIQEHKLPQLSTLWLG